ncbi:MAG: hypothetical protein NTX36_04000 [Proteobacteria bacterium]|nr:hypothetical protein [Pseudomonadota bacterium]
MDCIDGLSQYRTQIKLSYRIHRCPSDFHLWLKKNYRGFDKTGIQAKHPDKNYDADGVMSNLVKYNMKPDPLPDEVVETFSTAAQIAGKTVRTLFNWLSLL